MDNPKTVNWDELKKNCSESPDEMPEWHERSFDTPWPSWSSLPPVLPDRVWVTLLTRKSYLPGAILLAHSLQQQSSKYPLMILTTPSFPIELIPLLERECSLSNARHLEIQPLSPPKSNTPPNLIAARFEDTWTKLRAFELHKYGCKKLVFLDADMLVMRNMDELFDVALPDDWIAANHACVCNLDHDSWAPQDWVKENCAYTGLDKSSPPTPVPRVDDENGLKTHTLLNSGLFIVTPSESQWEAMLNFLQTDPRVKSFLFPDQDFLAEFFKGRWKSLSWKYNALKTMRYWHENIWEDDEVRNLHYIVDKPWSKRVGEDGVAGYLGKDGITHSWWWREYEKWKEDRQQTRRIFSTRCDDGGRNEAYISGILEMMRAAVDAEVSREGDS